jgi:hypothetical protein
MTRKNYALVAGVMLLAILLTNFGVFVASAISQENEGQERTLCIEDCKYLYAGVAGQLWRLYFACLTDCEKKMWKQWEKDMDKLEKD